MGSAAQTFKLEDIPGDGTLSLDEWLEITEGTPWLGSVRELPCLTLSPFLSPPQFEKEDAEFVDRVIQRKVTIPDWEAFTQDVIEVRSSPYAILQHPHHLRCI